LARAANRFGRPHSEFGSNYVMINLPRPDASVAMQFGTKPEPDNMQVDFNRVYQELIVPALEAAGLEVFRADQERRAGDIRTDMFHELLVADLVVADLMIDNP